MREFDPKDMHPRAVHKLLLSGVAPRPIALTATSDDEGNVNLAPFSFFNAFSGNPPVVVISPAFRGTDGSSKDTYENLKKNGKCTISIVTYDMVGQSNVASTIYPTDVNEFDKAGLTMQHGSVIDIPFVAESPFVMECSLLQCIELAPEKKGSGNLMILQVERIHVREEALNGEVMDPTKVELVARLGQDYYAKISSDTLFRLPAPTGVGVGFDGLSVALKSSTILSANSLSMLAEMEALPSTLQHGSDVKLSTDVQTQAEKAARTGATAQEIVEILITTS